MFENFVLVEKKKTISNRIVATVFFILMLILFYLGTVISPFIFEIPAIACGVAWYWLTFRSNVEYEYLYFDGDLKFTKIKDKRKRKRLLELTLDKVVVIAPRGSNSVVAYEDSREVYKRNFTSGRRDANVYELIFNDEEGTVMVAFEPDEKMLDAMRLRYSRIIMK
ncbi:MAG: DUF6106 family protein [Lachnospiraceae bacterium]|nr:DUF6106 family protein [Lachnospiraceae bacterium]